MAALPQDLLELARGGDHDAFAALVEPHRRELHAHCYRMLGSLHDAEDALQDALLRAWRGLPRFDGRSSLRAWLYRIATNTTLDVIGRRPKRVLPIDHVPAAVDEEPGRPLAETVWIEPYPADDYEVREGVELAFIAALQHLPATQRAVLILRKVLGFSAAETAAILDTTVPAVNSALQRARKAVDERLPERSQQETLRTLGDEELRALVQRYMDAMAGGDVDGVVALLTEDAAWSMPPLSTWYRGTASLRVFLELGPLDGVLRWRNRSASANGQPAVGSYLFDAGAGAFMPFALDVLTVTDAGRIADITAFLSEPEAIFARHGLPPRLDAETT